MTSPFIIGQPPSDNNSSMNPFPSNNPSVPTSINNGNTHNPYVSQNTNFPQQINSEESNISKKMHSLNLNNPLLTNQPNMQLPGQQTSQSAQNQFSTQSKNFSPVNTMPHKNFTQTNTQLNPPMPPQKQELIQKTITDNDINSYQQNIGFQPPGQPHYGMQQSSKFPQDRGGIPYMQPGPPLNSQFPVSGSLTGSSSAPPQNLQTQKAFPPPPDPSQFQNKHNASTYSSNMPLTSPPLMEEKPSNMYNQGPPPLNQPISNSMAKPQVLPPSNFQGGNTPAVPSLPGHAFQPNVPRGHVQAPPIPGHIQNAHIQNPIQSPPMHVQGQPMNVQASVSQSNIQSPQMHGPPNFPSGQQMYYQQPGLANQQPSYPLPQSQPGYPVNQSVQGTHLAYSNQQGGYPGQVSNYSGQQNQYGYQQQQAVKKLNPDQMPSPIHVIIDDQNANSGIFATSVKGRVPPLVTTDFIVVDQGNASPRFIRSSMYSVPATNEMMKQTAIPFCIVLSPLAEEVEEERPPPLLDFSVLTGVPNSGPIRCSRCKAYMCPAMRFVDAGRHFQCAFCKATTEVPMEYTQYLNNSQHYGQNTPEMSLGCYEIVATKEYCRNNVLPNPPALIFIIDVSYNAIRSGMVELIVSNIREMIKNLSTPPRIGVITYSSTIHFYNINENLAQPQMLIVGDINDVFVPLACGLLAEPNQADHLLDILAKQIPSMFKETKETETMLLPAVQAGLEALKAAESCGKLLIFHSSLPTAQAPGQLLNRDDRKLLGTDKEKNILNPQTKVYNEVAQECVSAGCGIDLFLFNNSYIDLATLGQLARLTGGSIFKYTYFQADIDGERVIKDLNRVLSRQTAYDAVMRVRTSTGVRATDFYGHFFMSNTTDIELATLDSDKAIAVEIKHDDKLTGEDGVYIQVALLYTHITGQRRLRICNLSLDVATQMADLYRCCDLDTFINFQMKQAVTKLSEHSPKTIKDGIIARCAQSLACYRKNCASPSSIGQLVLPESMKLLPLFSNCILRNDALSGGPDMTCDDRSWTMYTALCADVGTSVAMLYPRLMLLNPLSVGASADLTRCTIDKLCDDSIYLLENSIYMMLWIGVKTPRELIEDLFGVHTTTEINTEETELPVLNTQFNESVRNLIESVRKQRRRCMRLTLIKQNDKLEMVFRHFLVEDDSRNGVTSYMDFLCHVHKEIRALM